MSSLVGAPQASKPVQSSSGSFDLPDNGTNADRAWRKILGGRLLLLGTNVPVWVVAFGPYDSLYADGNFTTTGAKPPSRIDQRNGQAVYRSDLDGDGLITVIDIRRVTRWWGMALPYHELGVCAGPTARNIRSLT